MAGMLTHAEMVAVIKNGGVMQMADGLTIFRIEDLPTPADLAKQSGDPGLVIKTEADIDAEIERLKQQKAILAVPLTPPVVPDVPPVEPVPPVDPKPKAK
jgi:hypothetical protein